MEFPSQKWVPRAFKKSPIYKPDYLFTLSSCFRRPGLIQKQKAQHDWCIQQACPKILPAGMIFVFNSILDFSDHIGNNNEGMCVLPVQHRSFSLDVRKSSRGSTFICFETHRTGKDPNHIVNSASDPSARGSSW